MPLRLHRFFPAAFLCALLAAAVFLPGLGGDFLLDDRPTISENAAVQVTTLDAGSLERAVYAFRAGGGSRPLPMLSFALDHWRAGLNPSAFKATNLAVHAITTLALAFFLRSLLLVAGWTGEWANLAASALALAWAVHPLQVSSVLYVVQRMQTMSTLFIVLALMAYLAMRKAQLAGQRSRQFGVLTFLCWVLALACKEDAALLPAYTLVLELTLLRFNAANAGTVRLLRRGYLVAIVAAAAAYLLVFVPNQWSWNAYPGRDYSSPERLLTQARVICMYLWQIAIPMPSHLLFHYDWLQPSRSLLQPWTTLPALLFVAGMLAIALRLRLRRPLFALGVLLFLAGHFIASNVVGLELAFEHRNHFPLIGALLAAGDLLTGIYDRLRLQPRTQILASAVLLAFLGTGTLLRAQAWGDPVGFARYSTQLAPQSERAWIDLCQTHFTLSENQPGNPHFAQALATCEQGADAGHGATNLTNIVLLKTIAGTVQQTDWQRLFDRLGTTTMTPSNAGVAWHLVRYSNGDPRVDARNVLAVVDIVGNRASFRPEEYVAFGYYAIKKNLDDEAFRYFQRAVRASPPGSTLPLALVADLRQEGQPGLASRVLAWIESEYASRPQQVR